MRDVVPLGCGASAGSCSSAQFVEDLVGYGSATDYEGSGPAPALSSTTAALRATGGCGDTNANATDFTAGAPAPRNASSPANACSGTSTSGPSAGATVDIDIQPVISISLERSSLSFGTAVSGAVPAPISEKATVMSNDAAGYTLTVHRSPFAPADLPLGIADVGGRFACRDPDRAGVGFAGRELDAAERRWRRSVADQHRLRVGAARRHARPLHGDLDLHGDRTVIAVATGAAAAALSVSPVRIWLTGAASRTITIRNGGNAAATVDARAAGIAVDGRAGRWWRHGAGRPPRGSACDRAASCSGRTEQLGSAISVVTPTGASPGDHAAIVLFATRAATTAGVAVRLQIGVVVLVRVPGRIVHRLELGRLRVRQRVLEAVVTNRGNVVERTRVRIALSRHNHVLARLSSARRTLLPHSRGTARLRFPTRLRGWFTARLSAGAARRPCASSSESRGGGSCGPWTMTTPVKWALRPRAEEKRNGRNYAVRKPPLLEAVPLQIG